MIVWVTLSCCAFSYLACLMTSHHISRLLCFAPWMIFSSLVIDFDNIRVTLYTIYGRFVLSCCIFFVDADLLQFSLHLCDVPDASTSFISMWRCIYVTFLMRRPRRPYAGCYFSRVLFVNLKFYVSSQKKKRSCVDLVSMLYSILLMRSWSAVWDASNAVHLFLYFRLLF